MSLYSEAMDWTEQGLKVLPVHKNSKVLFKGFNGGIQLTKRQIVKFFSRYKANLCLVTGQNVDGLYLTVLDFDSFAAYRESGIIPNTRRVESTRGYHLYYWAKDKPPERIDYQYAEIKTLGQRIMLPPSVVNSNQYQVIDNKPIRVIDSIFDVANPVVILPDRQKTITSLTLSPVIDFTRRGIIQMIKDHVKLTDIFSPVYPSGDNYAMTHCPMPVHKRGDINPSLSLNLATNRVRCFKPSCPLWGDIIDVYQMLNGLSLKEALFIMARELGL